jgi:hypothetical protein
MRQRLLHVTITLSIVGMMGAGCAALPVGRFDALAAAGRHVEERTRDADARVILMTRQYMIFNPARGDYTVKTFVPAVEEGGRTLDFDFGPRLEPREAALDVLTRYLEALAAFAKKDYQAGLDEATQSLDGSVVRLASHFAGAEGAKQGAGILATAINGLGRSAIDHIRRAELKKTMGTARPGLEQLSAFVTDINAELAAAIQVMRRGMLRSASAARASSPGASVIELNSRVEGVIVDAADLLEELKSMTSAVQKIGPAHDEIAAALDGDDRAPLKKLTDLVAEVKRLQSFRTSLK